jgi:hypothetical protein
MKLNHTALYCKGWYKTREGGIKTMWMDMAHCIHADGYRPQTKKDVANWCLIRLDEMRNDKKFNRTNMIDLHHFINEMISNKNTAKNLYNDELDMYDLIILNYRNIIMECDGNCFTEIVKPNQDVLPVNLQHAWYSKMQCKLYPAMMMCDYMEDVERLLPGAKDELDYFYNFENVESYIKIKNWKDVVVINGSDNLNECFEKKVTGYELKRKMLTEKDQNGDDVYIDMNIYNSVTDFDDDTVYTCRFKQGEFEIKLMSVTVK